MAVTAAQIAQLRRWTGEPNVTPYTDSLMTEAIERYPLPDVNGEDQYTEQYQNGATTTRVENESWIPTYDLNAAAADIWAEKASTSAQDFNFSADGGRYDRSAVYEQAMKQSRYYRARRNPRSVGAEAVTDTGINVGNLPESP